MMNQTIVGLSLLLATVTVEGRTLKEEFRNGRAHADPSHPGYFNRPEYIAKTADEKLDELWAQCQVDQTMADISYSIFNQQFIQQQDVTFDSTGDELPPNRNKMTHAQGVVGLVDWEDLGNHSYTGLYKGEDAPTSGLIRISELQKLLPGTPGLTPSFAIKFPRDGSRSVNHLTAVSFSAVEGWNFFAHDFRSRVDMLETECETQTIEQVLLSVSSQYHSLGLSEFARLERDGTPSEHVIFPFELTFEPNPEVAAKLDELMLIDASLTWYEQLQKLEKETVLFSVVAKSHPDDPSDEDCNFEESVTQHIANIRLKSELITSAFGDERLFFQHESMRQDNDRRPEWFNCVERREMTGKPHFENVDAWPQDDETAKEWLMYSSDEYKCPFAWLLPDWIAPSNDSDDV